MVFIRWERPESHDFQAFQETFDAIFPLAF
jgi:hypothetical protein